MKLKYSLCLIIIFCHAASYEMNSLGNITSVYAIQTNVTDLDKAVSFYKDLGFNLLTKDHFPRVAPTINGDTMLVLHKVEEIIPTDPEGARTVLNMLVKNT